MVELLVGILLGAIVDHLAGRFARKEERAHQRQERVREREQDDARALFAALTAVHDKIPMSGGAGELTERLLMEAHARWQDGYFGITLLDVDGELIDRYRAVGQAVLAAMLDEGRGQHADTYVLLRAIRSARAALGAFMREEELPPRTFPPTSEIGSLARVGPKGRDLTDLHRWLDQHPDPM